MGNIFGRQTVLEVNGLKIDVIDIDDLFENVQQDRINAHNGPCGRVRHDLSTNGFAILCYRQGKDVTRKWGKRVDRALASFRLECKKYFELPKAQKVRSTEPETRDIFRAKGIKNKNMGYHFDPMKEYIKLQVASSMPPGADERTVLDSSECCRS